MQRRDLTQEQTDATMQVGLGNGGAGGASLRLGVQLGVPPLRPPTPTFTRTTLGPAHRRRPRPNSGLPCPAARQGKNGVLRASGCPAACPRPRPSAKRPPRPLSSPPLPHTSRPNPHPFCRARPGTRWPAWPWPCWPTALASTPAETCSTLSAPAGTALAASTSLPAPPSSLPPPARPWPSTATAASPACAARPMSWKRSASPSTWGPPAWSPAWTPRVWPSCTRPGTSLWELWAVGWPGWAEYWRICARERVGA